MAVEDEVVEADVEVVGITGVAGQSVVAVTANDPVVAEITDDPILASSSGELIIAGVPRKSVMPNPSCLCGKHATGMDQAPDGPAGGGKMAGLAVRRKRSRS